MMVRSLTSSTAVSEDGRRRSGLSGQLVGARMGGNIGKSPDGDDDWGPVYCFKWKGVED